MDAFAKFTRKFQGVYPPPPISHVDFQLFQYNNTREALKVFNYDWDFAIPCQGYQDYTRRETESTNCEKQKQWMLFKPHSELSYVRLYHEIDYEELSVKYTTVTPGFRKGDLVQEYISRYE